jgi:hypothetical protein
MIRRATVVLAPALAAIALAPALGCEQILGLHDIDAGPALQPGEGGDDSIPFTSSGASSSGDDGSFPGVSDGSSGGASRDVSSSAASSSGSMEAGPASLGFTPSNFNPTTVLDGGIDWSSAQDIVDGLPPPVATIAMNDPNATQADLFVLNSWVVNATTSLTISGDRPAIVLVLTTVDIHGAVTVEAGGYQYASPGPGVGQAGPNGGGAGASYCGVGGQGSDATAPFPAGGPTYGNATLTPLQGGSAGAAGNNSGGGGTGGGAVQIVAGTSIAVRQYGSINAGGKGSCCITTGGGSGGAILLEAPSVQIAGNVAANGGGGAGGDAVGADATANGTPAPGGATAGLSGQGGQGSAANDVNGGDGVFGSGGGNAGGGGGGAGRIRINTMSGKATLAGSGLLSPALPSADGGADGGAACATQGALGH